MNSSQITRRTILAATPLVFAACGKSEEAYFGNPQPPRTQRVVSALDNEPGSLDPATSGGLTDSLILSMFEGLTSLQPSTGVAMAALATHYKVTSDGLQYTFYLRGHPKPQGVRLPNTGDLPLEYSRGRSAPPDAAPARWSDGARITAHDFVYSWRRALSPSTAAETSYMLYPVRGAREINAGKLAPDQLGIKALDDFTLLADLQEPVPYFLELVSSRVSCAVPRQAIQGSGEQWTEPGRMVSSGAFKLRARRPYDSIVLERNPHYYDAGQVALYELTFLITRDLATLVNEYRAGTAFLISPSIPAILPILRRKKDFRPHPVYAADFLVINTRTPPFDDVRLRYALNMATDKRPISEFTGAGYIPALGLIPSNAYYQSPGTLPVVINGSVYDVLSFNPKAARELISTTGKSLPQPIELLSPDAPDALLYAQVLKDQWRKNLNVEVVVNTVEFQLWIEMAHSGSFRHIAVSGTAASYIDPAWFLDLFTGWAGGYGTNWTDPQYKAMLTEAKATSDPRSRLAKLGLCERRLLEAMPVLPMGYWVNADLRKPFVRGLGDNLLDRQQFKYVWIDTNWRPS